MRLYFYTRLWKNVPWNRTSMIVHGLTGQIHWTVGSYRRGSVRALRYELDWPKKLEIDWNA